MYIQYLQTPSLPLWRLIDYKTGPLNGYPTYDYDKNRKSYQLSDDSLKRWREEGYFPEINPWGIGLSGYGRRYSSLKQGDFIVTDNNGKKTWVNDELLKALDPNSVASVVMVNGREYSSSSSHPGSLQTGNSSVNNIATSLNKTKQSSTSNELFVPVPGDIEKYVAAVKNGKLYFRLPDNISINDLELLLSQYNLTKHKPEPKYQDFPSSELQSAYSEQSPTQSVSDFVKNLHTSLSKRVELPTSTNNSEFSLVAIVNNYPYYHYYLYDIPIDIYRELLKNHKENISNNKKRDLEGSVFTPLDFKGMNPGDALRDTTFYEYNPKSFTDFDMENTHHLDDAIDNNNASEYAIFDRGSRYTLPFVRLYDDNEGGEQYMADSMHGYKTTILPRVFKLEWNSFYGQTDDYENQLGFGINFKNNSKLISKVPSKNIGYEKIRMNKDEIKLAKRLDLINDIKSVPGRFATPFKEAAEGIKGAANKVKGFFGFKYGGALNYLNYIK